MIICSFLPLKRSLSLEFDLTLNMQEGILMLRTAVMGSNLGIHQSNWTLGAKAMQARLQMSSLMQRAPLVSLRCFAPYLDEIMA